MRGRHYPIEAIVDTRWKSLTPIYLDLTSRRMFQQWLRTNRSAFERRLKDRSLQVVIFEHQAEELFSDTEEFESTMKVLGIEFESVGWRKEDRLYASELQDTYFHDETARLAGLHAEFMILARRASIGENPQIITAYPSFQRAPNIATYLLGISNVPPIPAQFDIFQDIGLHSILGATVSERFNQGHYPDTVFEAVLQLRDHLRAQDSSLAESDGYNLVKHALGFEGTATNPKTTPLVALNNFATDSDRNEQLGYYHLCQGLVNAVRNLNAHHSSEDPYILERFGDQRTVAKLLCLVSLVLEKLDSRPVSASSEEE